VSETLGGEDPGFSEGKIEPGTIVRDR